MKTFKKILLSACLAFSAILAVAQNQSQGLVTPSSGILLNFHMDGNGNNFFTSPSDSTGPITPVQDAFGKANSAMKFNGVHFYHRTITGLALPDTALTLSAWVNLNSINLYGTVISVPTNLNTPPYNSFALRIDQSNQKWMGVIGTQNNPNAIVLGTNYTLYQWTHLALTYSSSKQKLTIFVNGDSISSIATSGLIQYSSVSFPVLTIGGQRFDGTTLSGTEFDGDIDEVYIYNRALSSKEIASLARRNDGLASGQELNLPFCGSLADYSGKQRNGTEVSVSGGITYTDDAQGNPNNAVRLVGGNYIILPAASYFEGPFSVSTHFKLDNITPDAPLFDFSNGQGYDNMVYTFSNGTNGVPYHVIDGVNSAYPYYATLPNFTPLNQWKHLVYTFDGIVCRVFLDGQLWYSFDHYDLVNPIVRSQNRIGSSSLGHYSNITLDEFRIYNRMLNLTEIQTLSSSYTCTGVVSVEKATSNSPVSLYPNPATDQVKVKLPDPTIQILTTEVFDVTGKQVYTGNNDIIPMNHLLPGIYLVKILTTTGQFVSRLQKQ